MWKNSPATRVVYISLVFSNARRVLSYCNTRLRLFYLLINVAMHWLVGLKVLYFHSIAIDFHFIQRVFNRVNMRHSNESCLSPSLRMNGRLNTRRRIMRLDKLGQTFVVRLVTRLLYKDGYKTLYLSGQIISRCASFKMNKAR